MAAVVQMTANAPRAARKVFPPAELRAVPQWVLWRWEARDGEPTKVPCSVRTGLRTDVRDPNGWGSYTMARRVLGNARGRYAGLGFVFTPLDPFCGIDLDNALDTDRETLHAWARAIVERLGTYAEVSPSGRGIKLFLRGNLVSAVESASGQVRHCRRGLGDDGRGSVEIYDERRFFTVTEWPLPGHLNTARVARRQAELNALYRELFPPPQPHSCLPTPASPAGDDVIFHRAATAANGTKFARLWAGDASGYGGDESARDAALCACLAFYTRDPRQIERLVYRSGCRRQKWDQRADYRERTIQFALANVTANHRRS
jgi:putative DNA primase/helicase